MNFDAFFRSGSGDRPAYPYQAQLAEGEWPETLVIPTGFGKTAAVLAAWLWKVAAGHPGTPRRLAYCLPMRTLVEQTEGAAQGWIGAARTSLGLEVQLDVLMGGRGREHRGVPEWILNPDRPTVLIGTQDLLVSAALMRGYGTSRYRWPVDFALLHNGTLWVFDEVQLAGAALPTSAQLEAFRREFATGRECRTLWMSATLDPAWLKTVDFAPGETRRSHDLSAKDVERARHLWTAAKTLAKLPLPAYELTKKQDLKSYAGAFAAEARERTRPGTNTILFLNTVARAQAVFEALGKATGGPERLLVHSRFRAADRRKRLDELRAGPPPEGRVVVATQALEAGVDVTSAVMISELAPWSSLVQRFGRCNRYGECGAAGAEVLWVDVPAEAGKPYEGEELAQARAKLTGLSACGPADLAEIPPSAPTATHVLRRSDLLDLFDTEPDLSGFDVDVSLYVRDAEDTDVRLFWRDVEDKAPSEEAPAPAREELCPAPIGQARELVKDAKGQAWRWDGLAARWRAVRQGEVFPGMVIWIGAAVGGYDPEKGFDTTSKKPVPPIGTGGTPTAAMNADPDAFTSKVRVSLARHSTHAREQAAALAEALGLSGADRDLVLEVARWHDLGKAHPAFVLRMGGVTPPLAKSPDFTPKPAGGGQETRPYFRHELASALAYLANRGWSMEANLAGYLIAGHHGKVRMRLAALAREARPADGRLFARGVWDGDSLPGTGLDALEVPETQLDLDVMQLGEGIHGSSWAARTQDLLREHGPFRLAWLEALVRIADWRASQGEEVAGHDDL